MIAPRPANETERLKQLYEMRLTGTPREVWSDGLCQLAATICQAPMSSISLISEDTLWVKSMVGIDDPEFPRDVAFCSYAILQPGMFIVEDATQDPRFMNHPYVTGPEQVSFFAGAPIVVEDLSIGMLCIFDRTPRTLAKEQADSLMVLARQIAANIELRRQNKSLKNRLAERDLAQAELARSNYHLRTLSSTDALTGLQNRRSFDDAIQRELALAQRSKAPLSLLMMDIDQFKEMNDSLGHAEGDHLLQAVGTALRRTVRASEFCARYGGDEFAVLMPTSSLNDAAKLAERVRRSMEEIHIGGRNITVSIGVGCSINGEDSPSWLVRRADEALYNAKRNGKNQICSHAAA